MDKRKTRIVENALKQIAMRESKTVSQVRKDINTALMVGMFNPDPNVQAYWKRIPHEGDIPTVEEVIIFLAEEAKRKLD